MDNNCTMLEQQIQRCIKDMDKLDVERYGISSEYRNTCTLFTQLMSTYHDVCSINKYIPKITDRIGPGPPGPPSGGYRI